GLGGHCIPVDPHYLSWKMRTLDFRTRFIELASEINASMPRFVVDQVRDALNDEGKAVRGSTVAILGVAYKKDIDDVRESPALYIIELLEAAGAGVVYHDPHVPFLNDERTGLRESVALTPSLLGQADVVLILTDHSCFAMREIVAKSRVLVDARNATAGTNARAASRRGVGWIVKGGLA
ncbi:MAG: UDP-N-acetyl-D-glucosamine dehydrogenase, partial [Gammaproteobacteria bacterium]|nr:UDP-N-acetyl-D-glucosamine dehydrogenase [Gammaproteobacteria bacterium]